MDAHLTLRELYALFDRSETDALRWRSSCDAQEYLAIVLYLTNRNMRESAA